MTCSKRRGGDIPRRVDDDVAARLGRETRRGTPRERVLSRRRRRRRARTRGVARRGDGRGRGLADRLRTRPRVVVVVVVVLGGRLSDRVRTPARARDGDVRHERGERRFRSVRARRRRERAARARAELGVAPTHGPPGGASSRRRRRVSHQMPSDVFYRDARANPPSPASSPLTPARAALPLTSSSSSSSSSSCLLREPRVPRASPTSSPSPREARTPRSRPLAGTSTRAARTISASSGTPRT